MKELTVQELKTKIDNKENFQLIDVREQHEYEICNLKGELIPMTDLLAHPEKIARDKDVVIYCRSGNRSSVVIRELEKRHGITNLYNLKGGIITYAKEIDTTLTVY